MYFYFPIFFFLLIFSLFGVFKVILAVVGVVVVIAHKYFLCVNFCAVVG